ncbi:hypothetical protein ACFSSC_11755 [Corynebacterium mendelii]|uniref:Uncharacterized protein n=1 Tax=Corynebacterium mendelii TaxID=2765362 RepID=A0A939E1M9_9CORY|nr:hypothetical protein [Corynebacterium mendelii]MBN9645324.1 hypothetical protein [Corynebacterium mendelii]
MKRFALLAAATAVTATSLVAPVASAEENTLDCTKFSADFKANNPEEITAKDYADQYRDAILKKLGKSYGELTREQKRQLRAQVDAVVKAGQACSVFKEEDRSSSATGSFSLSSAISS